MPRAKGVDMVDVCQMFTVQGDAEISYSGNNFFNEGDYLKYNQKLCRVKWFYIQNNAKLDII